MASVKHYDECYFVDYDSYDDLNLYEVGCQKCLPSYSFGPIIRNNYVLHYIISGRGTLFLDEKEFSVSAHQAFITPPFLPAFYKADSDEPWSYIWIHFNGQKAMDLLHQAGITREHPVFIAQNTVFSPDSSGTQDSVPELEKCLLDILYHHENEYHCIGNLYHMFQILINTSSRKPDPHETDCQLNYIRNVINYIRKKYADPIHIQDIADYCGLDRSYLSKLFKNATNYSPQEYLIYVRMNKAKKLLKNEDLSIQNIAYSVGYPDPFAFSKIFKKEVGISPSVYREQYLRDNNKKES